MRIVLALLAAFSVTGCYVDFGSSERYQTDFHYTFELKPGGRIDVASFNGSVEVTGWDENRVEVSGVKYASTETMRDQITIDARNTPDSVELRAIKPSARFGNMGARFTLRVPRTAVIERITTSNGSIRVRDAGRASHLTTSNSSIRAENLSGDLNARTSNGSIDVDSVRGELILTTSNSRIRADNVEGRCEAGTSNGSIDLNFRKSPPDDVRAHTNNSGITVHLPMGSNARIQADTSNGSIRSDFDLTQTGGDEKHHLSGTVGRGGPVLELKTSNGSIHIVRGGGE